MGQGFGVTGAFSVRKSRKGPAAAEPWGRRTARESLQYARTVYEDTERSAADMAKIKVNKPVVELDGDEMAPSCGALSKTS